MKGTMNEPNPFAFVGLIKKRFLPHFNNSNHIVFYDSGYTKSRIGAAHLALESHLVSGRNLKVIVGVKGLKEEIVCFNRKIRSPPSFGVQGVRLNI